MRDRETVRLEVAGRMTALNDRRYAEHKRDGGKSYIGDHEFRRICISVAAMKDELSSIKRLCVEEYFIVAPDRRRPVTSELTELEEEIDAYRASVGSVFRKNPYWREYVDHQSVPVFTPIRDPVCHLARAVLGIHPIRAEYLGEVLVPVSVRYVR